MCSVIAILTANGGPDENPRNPSVSVVAIGRLLYIIYNLDEIFIATDYPGRSA